MHWLIPAQSAALAGTCLLALVFYYLYTQYRHTYLKVWAAAWTVYAFRFIVELAGSIAAAPLAATMVCQSVTLLSGILLLSGTYAYLSRPMPRAWFAAGGIGLFWMLAAAWLGTDFRALTGATSIVIAAAYAWTGWFILRSHSIQRIGKSVAGGAFVAWSLLKLGYPVWGTQVGCEEWIFLAATIMEVGVAVGFLLMYFEDSRAELARGAEQLRRLVQTMPVMLDAFDENLNFIAWNQECERVTGYSSAEIINNPRALESLYPDPDRRSKMLADIEASGFHFRDREWELAGKTGEPRTVSWSNISRDFPIPGWHSWAVGVDVTQRRRVEQELRSRARQQEAVARLGQLALAGGDSRTLLKEAVHAIGRTLSVEFCEVLELMPEGDRLVFRAGLPEVAELIDRATVDAGQASQAGYTLLSREPVIMVDIDAENRFRPHPLMRAHGIVSGMSAVIGGRERPFGVLNASTTRRRTFTQDDTHFLQSVANVLAAAIERKQAEDALRQREQASQKWAQEESVMSEIGRIISSTLNIEEVYDQFAAEVKKILPFDRIAINLIDCDSQAVISQYVAGLQVAGRRAGDRFDLAGTATAAVAASGCGMLLPGLPIHEIEARFPGHLPVRRAGIQTALLAPLVSKGRVFGALVIMSADPGRYTERDIPITENVASQISGAIAHAQMFTEHKRMADALVESEASLKSIFRVAPVGIGVVHDRILTQVNDRVCEMLAYTAAELVGNSARMLYPTEDEFEFVGREKYIQIRAKGTGSVETRWQRKDGSVIDVLLSSTPLDPSDISRGVIFTALDITERKRAEAERLGLEERLRQAQKMEAIGTLAGGIAHDFNNILAAIIGFGELAKIEASANAEATASINEILKASFRARDLVRQILTFSRRAEAEFTPIQAHLIVKEAAKLLRASLPATINVRQNVASQAMILGDPTQIHQVVMNLCTNAYHAMREKGGKLEVGLAEVLVDETLQPEFQDLSPGRYLKLSVRDTGHGIEPGLIHRIFDPYFTTKEKTKGTGLGLAVVHGIVKNHKGAIRVASRLGEGTTFEVYFPIAEAAAAKTTADEEAAAGGSERILFVDDEPAIEALGKRLLGSLGYDVLTCANAGDALDLFRSNPNGFDMVITDMTMPGMTGDRMAVEMLRLRPELPVIVCTGFNELLSAERVQEVGIRALLMKPFLKAEAAKVIREVFDRR